jgi:glycosyltransferase involved in cell wall biosynthesis
LREDIDLVFFVGQYDLAAKLRRTPYIVTIWDLGHRDWPELPEMSSNREFEYREWRIQNIAKKAAYVIVDSELTKSNLMLLYGLKSERIVSIPFVTKIQDFQNVEERESFAFYPAHFWSHKNHSILLYSIQNLLEQNIKPRQLVLTGLDRGSKPFIDKLVRELEIQDYVKYIGFVSRNELEELYKKAAVTVMPSLLGPTNLPPLESLSQGCPVVVSENGSSNLDKYDSVIVLNPLDVEAWSNVMSTEFIFQPVDRNRFNEIQASLEEENLVKVLQIVQNCKQIARTYK